jgi:hypothetical protein
MTLRFEWGAADKLQKITTSFDDLHAKQEYLTRRRAADVPTLFFGYHGQSPAVFRVAEGAGAPSVPTGPPVLRKDAKGVLFAGETPAPEGGWLYPVLANHPLIDPGAVALLDGEIATTIAGNSYFNPFVWDGLHVFRLRYDSAGRVAEARELGANNLIRFVWSNHQLQTLTAFDISDKAERQVYKRSMGYDGDQLTSETVEYGGKSYKITYLYQGNAMASAAFTDTGAHDSSEHKVRFVIP